MGQKELDKQDSTQELREEEAQETRSPRQIRKFLTWKIGIPAIIIGLVGIVGFYFLKTGIKDAYASAFEQEVENTYQRFYDTAYENAEKNYHVSNQVTIEISRVQEIAKLEVLVVPATEYVIRKAEDNSQNMESWIRVKGEGVFTVDLSIGEYIVDAEHKTVLARVPVPVLSDCRIDNENGVEIMHFSNDIWNDDFYTGEKLAQDQIAQGQAKIRNSILGDREYNSAAKEFAERLIIQQIKEFNPETPDLTVEVEFLTGE